MYEVKVNGLLMDTKPTYKGALALAASRFWGRPSVTVERKGVVLWRGKCS